MGNEFIPIYQPTVTTNQRKYVLDCLDTNWISSRGDYINKFEEAVADFLGVNHVVTTCNGSVSLILALTALGIGHKDEVITQSLTYAATVSSIINVGATPVLIDSCEDFQMNLELVEKAITKKTKAVIIAQLYGDSPDILRLKKLCDSHDIALIEDSAECFGCLYEKTDPHGYMNIRTDGKKVGSLGIASSFSFFGNKTITTGEGGCVCTNDSELANKFRLLKSQSHVGGFKHHGPGFNFRMTNIQAAIGLAQFEDLKKITKRKLKIADYYRTELSPCIQRVIPRTDSTEWMPLFVLPKTIRYVKFNAELRSKGIDSRPCFTPIHLMEGFKYRRGSQLKVCEKIYKYGFNLPSYPDLTDQQLEHIVQQVNEVVNIVGD
jgi:perosamine synthetase